MTTLAVHNGIGLREGADFRILAETESVSVTALLRSKVGQKVHLVAHHDPPSPPLEGEPGGGCCLYRGECPAGHHYRPKWLYHFTAHGEVKVAGNTFEVGGLRLDLDLLEGHRCQLVLAALPEIPKAGTSAANPQKLAEKISGLQDLLKSVYKGAKNL